MGFYYTKKCNNNGKESNISEVTFDDVKYYSVSLIIK